MPPGRVHRRQQRSQRWRAWPSKPPLQQGAPCDGIPPESPTCQPPEVEPVKRKRGEYIPRLFVCQARAARIPSLETYQPSLLLLFTVSSRTRGTACLARQLQSEEIAVTAIEASSELEWADRNVRPLILNSRLLYR